MNAVVEPRRHRLSIAEYERMAAAGVLPSGLRVELLDGDLIETAPMGLAHLSLSLRLTRLFVQRAQGRAAVSPGYPIALPPGSMPEPDFALLRPRADDYAGARPAAADVLLLVEVSDSSMPFDAGVKARVYASHAIPEYWIVDVAARRLIVHRNARPLAGDWGTVDVLSAPFAVAPLALPGLDVSSTDLWPERS
jgi:Uma2 family endonuclease